MSWRASTVRALLALTLLAPASSALAAAPAEAPAAASAKTQTVGELLASFAVMKGFEASFTEEKHLALLAAPLKSSGKLYYAPPGRFARVVEAPQRSTVVITATSLTMTDATGKQAIDLRARPDVKTFVESFLMVLAGDERGLAKVYRLEIAAADPEDVRAGWVLTLTPRGEPLSRLVKGLTLRGHGLHVTTVRVDEVSGDWSEITVRDADPYRAFTDEEKARLFGGAEAVTSGARAVAASLLVMAALGAYVALEMRVTTDITRFFPAGEARDEVTLAQEITTSELSRTMVLVARAPDEATAVRASRALEAALRAEPTLAGKLAFVEAGPPEGVDRALWELYLPRRLGFVAPSPEAARALTTDAALSAAAERLKERLASPMSTLLSRVAPKDPLLVVPDLFDRAAQSRGDGVAVVDGRFVTGDGKGAVVFLGTVAASFDGAAQKGVLAGIDRAFERARSEVGAELTLLESGANRFAVRAESAIKADITRVTTLSLAGLVLLFLVLFRSPRLVLLTGLPIGAGMLVGTAGCLAVFGAVHGLTLAFGAALIGVSIDYTVHFYSHHALDPDDGGPGATMRRVWPGLLLGAATTVAGFVSLAISSFPGLRELAVFGALGIAGALVATRVFLPVLVPRAPKPVAASRWLAGALDRAVGALRARRALPWALLLAVVALAAVGLPQATWEDDMAKLAERDPDLLREDDAVREQVVRYEQRRFVVALGDTDEAALAVDDRVADVLAAAQGAGEVDGYRALAALLPSAARQAAVREAFVSAPGLGARFDAAFEAAGFAPGAFAGFHEALAEPAPAPLTFADLAASPLAPFVRSFRVGLGDRVAILAFVAGVNAPDALAARLAAAFPGGEARLMDVGEVLSRGYARYRERMVELLGAGLLVVLLLVFLRYRRALPTAAAFLPAILAAVATVAVLALVGQPLNVLSLTALLMVVSMGVDYGVFLAETRGGGAELGATLVALVLACLSTVLGFGLLALSSNPALRSLGLTAGVGVLLSLLLAPTVLVLTRQKEPT